MGRVDAYGDCFRYLLLPIGAVAFLDGIVYITIATLFQPTPDIAFCGECLGRGLGYPIHQEGKDAVLPDVFRNVLLGVVGTHLGTVVDVLLEDVAQHIRIDVFPTGRDACVEMPPPGVEEVEQTDEGLILDVDVGIVVLQLMLVEHPSIQVGYAAIHLFKVSVVLGLVQSIVEKPGEEASIEGLEEAVLPLLLAYPMQFVL